MTRRALIAYSLLMATAGFTAFGMDTSANQDLLNGAASGNFAAVKRAITSGANVNHIGIATVTPCPQTATGMQNQNKNTVPLWQIPFFFFSTLLPWTDTNHTPPVTNNPTDAQCTNIKKSALQYATQEGSTNVVDFLLENSANPNLGVITDDGKCTSTPLHAAVQNKNEQTAQLLIRHGANTTAKDWASKTPIEYAEDIPLRATLNNAMRMHKTKFFAKYAFGIAVACSLIYAIYHWYNDSVKENNNGDNDVDEIMGADNKRKNNVAKGEK